MFSISDRIKKDTKYDRDNYRLNLAVKDLSESMKENSEEK